MLRQDLTLAEKNGPSLKMAKEIEDRHRISRTAVNRRALDHRPQQDQQVDVIAT